MRSTAPRAGPSGRPADARPARAVAPPLTTSSRWPSRPAPRQDAPAHAVTAQLATAALATAILTLTPCSPTSADASTPQSSIAAVTPAEAVAAARALPKPVVDKGRVWALFGVGAAAVFGGAVAAERVEALFPAIAKANRAVADARARGAREEAAIAAQEAGELDDAVAAGLEEARRRRAEGGGE